jgi:hypothetical protein
MAANGNAVPLTKNLHPKGLVAFADGLMAWASRLQL